MKRFLLPTTFVFLLLFITTNIFAQNNQEQKYRRSSLTMILLTDTTTEDIQLGADTYSESEVLLYRKISQLPERSASQLAFIEHVDGDTVHIDGSPSAIRHLWDIYPFPDKYDKHSIATDSINIIRSTLSEKELKNMAKVEVRRTDSADIAKTVNRFADKGQNVEYVDAAAIATLSSLKQKQLATLETARDKELTKLANKSTSISGYEKGLKKIDKKIGGQIQDLRNEATEKYTGRKRSTDSEMFDALMHQKKSAKQLQPKIEQQLLEQTVAKQLVKQWFSSEDGSKFWDMSTIQKRGYYNATELEADIAKNDVRGMAALADAGEELLNNSFVTVTDVQLFDNKPIARLLESIGNQMERTSRSGGAISSLMGGTAQLAFFIAAKAIEDGYTVLSKTFLYKLKWDDEVAAEFYQNWGNDAAFEKMTFNLEFVGVQYNKSTINAGVFSKADNRKKDVVIRKAVMRNIDDAFATLQKDYDVFKPKVPVLGTEPVTAQVGMKEGLKGGERFEVLQQAQDLKTGRMKWQRIGVVTVDDKNLWDNRYNAGEEPDVVTLDKNGNPISATTFKGGLNVVPGMMLKQIK